MKEATKKKQNSDTTETKGNVKTGSSFQLKSLGDLLKKSFNSEDLVKKRNWWSKKPKSPASPRDFGVEDTIGTFITWNKGKHSDVKTKKIKKKKAVMTKKEQEGDVKQEMNDRMRIKSKLPQILKRQQELEDFQNAEKDRIAKQDEALLEIDNLLANLGREEPKTIKTFESKKSTLPSKFQSKDDSWRRKDDNKHNVVRTDKPITYHDSLTDSLDKLLEDIEESMN